VKDSVAAPWNDRTLPGSIGRPRGGRLLKAITSAGKVKAWRRDRGGPGSRDRREIPVDTGLVRVYRAAW